MGVTSIVSGTSPVAAGVITTHCLSESRVATHSGPPRQVRVRGSFRPLSDSTRTRETGKDTRRSRFETTSDNRLGSGVSFVRGTRVKRGAWADSRRINSEGRGASLFIYEPSVVSVKVSHTKVNGNRDYPETLQGRTGPSSPGPAGPG